MFWFERLIGVASYSLALALICISLVGKSGKKVRIILFFYSVILSIFAYNYVPYETADLYRIYQSVDNLKTHSFSFIIERIEDSELSLYNILYWAVGQTGIPQILPTVVTFVCYSCIFYIICKTAEKNRISGKNVALALFFYMSIGTYMFVISGIRCMLGVSLLSFCFYRESVEKKFNILHIILYFTAAFIHAFVAVLVVIRFIVAIFDTKTTILKKLIYFVFLCVGTVLVLRNFSDYIDEIMRKANGYLSNDVYSYIWEYIIAILTCVIIVIAFSKYKCIKRESHLKLNVWFIYEMVLFATAVCFCYEFTIFHRLTTYIMPIISLPFLMTTLQLNDNIHTGNNNQQLHSNEFSMNLNSCVVVISVLLLLVTCSRGTLSSLKFFVW